MATLRFNNNIIEAARRLGETRTDATSGGDSGKTYTSAILSKYQNDSVRRLLRDAYLERGEGFVAIFPEYVKRMAPSAMTGNQIQKPSDAWYFIDLFDGTGGRPLTKKMRDLSMTAQGFSPFFNDSFWETATILQTVGPLATASVTGYYIKKHVDIVPDNTPATPGGGKWDQTSFATWTAATKTLVAGANPSPSGWVAGDIGKAVVFFDSSALNVYDGVIATVPGLDTVTLTGWNLPTGNLAGVINRIFMPESQLASGDLELASMWDDVIVSMMVDLALKDATASLDLG